MQMTEAKIPQHVIPLLSFKSVERFAMKYGKPLTRRGYLGQLGNHLRWLRDFKGVLLTCKS